MLHILIVYTFFYFLFENDFKSSLLCPQLVVKTKYTDALIKLSLIYWLTILILIKTYKTRYS